MSFHESGDVRRGLRARSFRGGGGGAIAGREGRARGLSERTGGVLFGDGNEVVLGSGMMLSGPHPTGVDSGVASVSAGRRCRYQRGDS